MKNTFIVVVIALVAIIIVLAYKKSQDDKNADNLLGSGATTTTTTENGVTTTTTTNPVANTSGFKVGDAVIVKSGSAMRTLSDPNIIAYQTTTSQKGWIIDRELFSGSFKSGTSKASGTWAIISKSVVGFGFPSWVSGTNSMVKLYQVVHISRITKA